MWAIGAQTYSNVICMKFDMGPYLHIDLYSPLLHGFLAASCSLRDLSGSHTVSL